MDVFTGSLAARMDMGNMTVGNSTMGNSTDTGGDMDGMDMGGSCKISMLWNWYTVDSCFLSSTWHNKTKADFAGSVIGVFFLCMAIEAVRRMGREYDRRLVQIAMAHHRAENGPDTPLIESGKIASAPAFNFTPSWIQQVIRSLVYGSQFTAAFLVMLMGMYYNGYILFAIFLGQTVGYVAFGRDTAVVLGEGAASGSCC